MVTVLSLFLLLSFAASPVPDETLTEQFDAPGDGLGLETNRPPAMPGHAPMQGPGRIPLPGAGLGGLGGLAAVAGLASGLSRPGGRRRRSEHDDGEAAFDGDLRSVLGLQAGEEVLLLQAADDGRVAVRVGPADARYVAILVPGTGADVTDTGLYLERARNLRAAAQHAAHHGSSVAVVYALPFDAPDHIIDMTDPFGSDCACMDHKAHVGSAELTDFVASLDLDGSEVTVVGYSYGSTVVGYALADGELSRYVDRALFVGSPGVGVSRAEDLNLAPGTVYAAQSTGDTINNVPPMESLWLLPFLGPAAPLVAVAYARKTDNLVHGVDPTAERFGATFVETGDFGHGEYFDSVDRLEHIGRVVVGRVP